MDKPSENVPESLTVACSGAGYFAQYQYEAWDRIERATPVASVNRTIAKAEATGWPAYSDLGRMLDEVKPDLLDIITPPETHLESIKLALAKGVKAIICQKPFCANYEESLEATKLASEAGIPLIVHDNYRFQPWYRVMKDVMDEGKIGTVQQATFRLRPGDGQGPEAYMDRQPYFQKMPKLLIHETGVHWIDTFIYLFGSVTSVYADLRKLNPVIAGEDAGIVLMDHDSGVRTIFDGNRHLDHAADNPRMTLGEGEIEGTEGTLRLLGDGAVTLRSFGDKEEKVILEAHDWPGFAGDCVYNLQKHAVDALLSGTRPENLAADYLSVIEVEDKIYHSAELGQKMIL